MPVFGGFDKPAGEHSPVYQRHRNPRDYPHSAMVGLKLHHLRFGTERALYAAPRYLFSSHTKQHDGECRLMEWYVTLIAGLGFIFALFLSGAPIFIAFLFAILVGVYNVIGSAGFPMFANSVLDTVSITSLASIPMFI